ncbi:DUF937 domain-containing protein [Campylobacter suis]|uniref:DUF937 domain-containing protein n=1 Tax=Campylobacter suis TaxID=2790657 RepID=A0ABM8Q1F5_9BACT|nr:DUF937 domain-containing protein [Campylobacter suis]CAD7286653.1 hypothetical protein LMG8286_00470 [Campylobacter suis]
MNILNLLLSSGLSQNTIEQMANKTGLDPADVSSVIAKVAPVFMQRANANFKSDEDSSQLLDLIKTADMKSPDAQHGKELLGFLTGSKENSRALAGDVGSQLGIDAGSIKQLLPLIAPLVAGLFNKQVNSSNLSQNASQGDLTSMLTNFIDQNNDGSIVDDLFKMAGNFFGKKA